MRLIIAILASGLAVTAAPATAQTFTSPDAFAMDGDNIGMIGPDGKLINIRMWGIAAPEMKDATGHGWAARLALDALLIEHGQPVACEQVDRDRHKRPVAVCRAADGADLGEAMIAAGWATEYRMYSRNVPALADVWPLYAAAEARAAADRRGRWAGGDSATSWVGNFDRFQTLIIGFIGFIGVWGTAWWGFRNAREGRRHDAELGRMARRDEFDLDCELDELRRDYEARKVAAAVAAGLENLESSALHLLKCFKDFTGGNKEAMPGEYEDAERFWPPSLDIYNAHIERIGMLGPARAAHAGYYVNLVVGIMKSTLFNFYKGQKKGLPPPIEDIAVFNKYVDYLRETKKELLAYAGVQSGLFERDDDQAGEPEE